MQIIDEIVKNEFRIIDGVRKDGDEHGKNDKFNPRKHGVEKPDMIIIHGTGGKSYEYAKETLYAPDKVLSTHFIIKEDGTIIRMVPEDMRAYHTGPSRWKNLGKNTIESPDINSRSIGIEISNRIEPGKKKRNKYTKEQIQALTELCDYLQKRYNIKAENIIGHSDIAPGRKQDPWENFPWKKLAKKRIGTWPKTKLRDHFNNRVIKKSPSQILALLEKIGYKRWQYGKNKDGKPLYVTLKNDITSFQLHYQPSLYQKTVGKGKEVRLTNSTIAKMKAMARNSTPTL